MVRKKQSYQTINDVYLLVLKGRSSDGQRLTALGEIWMNSCEVSEMG